MSCKSAAKFTISSKNSIYGKSKNCLYLKKEKSLVAVTMKTSTLNLPKKIKRIKEEGISVAGKRVLKIVVNHSLKEMGLKWCIFENTNKIGDAGIKIYMKGKKVPKLSIDLETEELMKQWRLYAPKKVYGKYKKRLKEIKGNDRVEVSFKYNAWADICCIKTK